MTIDTADLIARLEGAGVQLWREGGQLRFRAPKGALSSSLRDELTASREAVLAALLAREAARITLAPLSYGQRSLWLVQQERPHSAAYNVAFAVSVASPVNIAHLREALQALTDRHAVLRTTYHVVENLPQQHIAGFSAVEFAAHDCGGDGDAALRERVQADYRRPFDLQAGPVWRSALYSRSPSSHVLLICAHHIAVDGWSLLLLLDELRQLLAGLAAGHVPALPLPETTYVDYVAWQAQMLAGEEGEQLARHWQAVMRAPRVELELPSDRPRPQRKSGRGATREFVVAPPLLRDLQALARAEGTTLYVLMLAAFKVLLMRHAGVEDVVVGTPTLGRDKGRFDRCVGHFVNPVPLRTLVEANLPFRALLGRVRDTLLAAVEAQEYPLALMVERLRPERVAGRSPLFETMFVLQRFEQFGGLARLLNAGPQARLADFGGLSVRPFPFDQQEGQFDLGLGLVELDEGLSGAFKYAEDLFDASTVDRLAEAYLQLLQSVVTDPGMTVSGLRLVSPARQEQLVRQWNETAVSYPHEQTVHGLFEAQAARTPNAPAVIFGHLALDYVTLNARANQVAHYLRALGVGRGSLVGVWLDRSIEMVVAVLGVLKAGGGYVPLDPAFPKDRIDFMMSDAELAVVLTQSHLVAAQSGVGPRVVCMDGDANLLLAEPDTNPTPLANAGDLAYVIYTSGSTGRPKGVMIDHRPVVNFLLSMHREPGITSADRFVAVTTLSFDIAGLEIHGPLTVGGTVVLASRATAIDGVGLAELLESSEATLLQATPATWRLLLDSGWKGRQGLKMLCGGERLPRDLASRLLATGGELWNMYGPTETTIWSTVGRVAAGPAEISIGRPIANTTVYVVDRHGEPVPIGVPGEILIGGAGVALGYHNRPDLTAERFVEDPFSSDPAARLYCTGDVARWGADGRLYHLGRFDHQVKIRGFRIELGEIEAALAEHDAVRQALVVAHDAGNDDRRLVAYVVFADGEDLTASDVRRFLRRRLPDYMIPSLVVALPSMPLTPNGKVDRSALPDPFRDARETPVEIEPPAPGLETLLATIWREVLQVGSVGAHDNFFELGGHSLLTLRVARLVETQSGHQLDPRQLFYQNLRQVAATLETTGGAT